MNNNYNINNPQKVKFMIFFREKLINEFVGLQIVAQTQMEYDMGSINPIQ